MTDPTEKPAATRHLPYLDGLRALAALFVVLHHAVLQVDFSTAALDPILKKLIRPLYFGHYAVDLFIVLSGFCLMIPVVREGGTLKGGVLRFFKRRAWRILPAYYFAVGLSLLLIWGLVGQKTGTHWDISLPVTGKSICSHLTMMHDVVGEDFSINHVLWSIAVECRLYLFFPLLLFLWRKLGPLATLSVACVVSFGLFLLCVRSLGASLHFHYLGLFTMGMFAAGLAFSGDPRLVRLRNLPWGLATVLGGFLFVAALVIGKGRGETVAAFVDYAFGAFSMAFLVGTSRDLDGWLARLLGWRPLAFVGTFAYSIYLIHAPLLQVLWQYPFASLQAKPLAMFLALSTAGTFAIVAIAYLFFLAFERPFLHRGKVRSSEQPVDHPDRKVTAES